MSLFITPQGEYPRHIGDLLLAHSDWVEGTSLPEGWVEVAYANEIPVAEVNQVVYEVAPSVIDGVLTQTFASRDLTAQEIEAREIRQQQITN